MDGKVNKIIGNRLIPREYLIQRWAITDRNGANLTETEDIGEEVRQEYTQ